LCLSEDFAKDLLHWRTSRPHDYRRSPLNSFPEADAAFGGGIAPGQPVRNVKLGDDEYLLDRIGSGAGFHVLVFTSEGDLTALVEQILIETHRLPIPIIRVLIRNRSWGTASRHAELEIADPAGQIARKFAAAAGTVYLLRPDLHVCARWRQTDAVQVCQALRIASCTPNA
jgi:3-(3-hydroxy-phenyl)propionate hydroxylase